MKVKAYRVCGRELKKQDTGGWTEQDFAVYTLNPKKIEREGSVIVGQMLVEPVKAVIGITDEMLLDATFEPYVPRKRKNKEEMEEVENDE